jgi:GH15 family glucan-1,4-alpha-glucosidase
MAWVALDRAIRSVQEFGSEGPLDRWIPLRAEIHDEICRLGYSNEVNSFVQYFGGKELDASLLLLPIVGFLPADDPRMINTVTAIEKHLMQDGFVMRYTNSSGVDGLPGSEGAFLACSFWLVDNYVLQNRHEEATALFERLMAVRNDVGLLSEEYDPKERRQLGNFPQAFSHLSLVNSVQNMTGEVKPAKHRSGRPHHK